MLNVYKTGVTSDSAVLVWESNGTNSKHDIYLNNELVHETSKCGYKLTGLKKNTDYIVYIKSGEDMSNVVEFSTASPKKVINVVDKGAEGDGRTINTKIIQKCIDEADENTSVYIPAGKFSTGALFLKGNSSLIVDGCLIGANKLDEFPVIKYRWEGQEKDCYAALINTYEGNHENITIMGSGTIDGNGDFLFPLERENKDTIERGRVVCIRNTDGIYIEGVTIRNTPAWCLHTIYSTRVLLHDVKIHTKYDENGKRYEHIFNGDGFDPDSCRDVIVFDCEINSQDDCIAIKSGRDVEGRSVSVSSSNILVSDSRFLSGFGVAVGSENSGSVSSVRVQNCVFIDTYSVGSVKTPRGRGSFINNVVYDGCEHINSSLEHEDCKWFRGALYIDSYYSVDNPDLNEECEIDAGTPYISNVTFKNIETATVAGNTIYVSGIAENKLQNITLENIKAHGKSGMKAYNINGLKIKNLKVTCDEGNDIEIENVIIK